MNKPFKTSLTVLGGIGGAGLALQLAFGSPGISLLGWPVSLIAAALIVLAIAGMALYREKAFFRLVTGVPFSVSIIGAMLVCCLVAGIVPQRGMPPDGLLSRAGIYAVTSSWPFVLLYLTLLLSLGCIIAGVLASSGFRRRGFLLNHLGLWLVLLGAGMGSADYRDLRVKVYEGETAVHATDNASGIPTGMPFAIRLDDFRMEEYPVRWGVVDIRTNRFQPEKRPVFYDTEAEAFAANPAPAPHSYVASTVPSPSYFASEIAVALPQGGEERAVVEVNRPYRRGSWRVYQYGYDQTAGNESGYSVLQLVRDPWLPAVYAGIAMLALGALSLFGSPGGRRQHHKKQSDGME